MLGGRQRVGRSLCDVRTAAVLLLGRKEDKNSRILKVVALIMAAVYFWRQYGHHGFKNVDFHLIEPPENYYGTSSHQQHGYIGLMPNGQPSWTPKPMPEDVEDIGPELQANGFHIRLSDALSLDRNATDFRDPLCVHQTYRMNNMFTTSVIFVFHNEALSTLLRSVHSVLNRTPPQLLREIILVDDSSTTPALKAELELHLTFLPKVRLVRLPRRSGLVVARLTGIKEASAETFTILDSHIEVQPGWLEPLMQRISESPTTVVMPIIDSIDAATFELVGQGIGCTLGFLWSLVEHSIPIQAQDQAIRQSSVDPIRSPTMAGGLFAAHKAHFMHLGGYDRRFGFWGAENLELSFRIWQCGGSLECMPCSRVNHIFRQGGKPYSEPEDHLPKNRLRTAAIWMDEYGAVVRKTLADTHFDIGPLDEMRNLRKDLQCKNFSWFLHNVYPESLIVDITEIVSLDMIRNPTSNTCLDAPQAYAGMELQITPCRAESKVDQSFLIHRNGQIRPVSNLELCLSFDLQFVFCENVAADGITWQWTQVDDHFIGLFNLQTRRCLTATPVFPVLATCNGAQAQHWYAPAYRSEL